MKNSTVEMQPVRTFTFTCSIGGNVSQHDMRGRDEAKVLMKHEKEFPDHKFFRESPKKKDKKEMDSRVIDLRKKL